MSGARGAHAPERLTHRVAIAIVVALVATVLTALPSPAAELAKLVSLSISSTAVTAGQPAQVSYRVESEQPLTRGYLLYVSSGGRSLQADLPPNAPLEGRFDLAVPDGYENGEYRLVRIVLVTGAGLTSYVSTSGPAGTGALPFELSTFNLTVTGSQVDTLSPHLTSLTLPSTAVGPGHPYTVRWAVAEDHVPTLLELAFTNDTPGQPVATEKVSISDPAVISAGAITRTVPATALNGHYVLQKVTVADSVQNAADYLPDGRVVPRHSWTLAQTHAIDFGAVRLTVAGSTVDVTAPGITALRLTPAVRHPDTLLTLAYTLDADDATSVVFGWRTRGSTDVWQVAAPTPVGRSGAWQVYAPSLTTVYELVSVTTRDRAGNEATYDRAGRWTSTSRTSGSHPLSFPSLDLTSTPSPVGVTGAPHAKSVELTLESSTWELPDITGYTVTVTPGGRVVDVPPTDYRTVTRIGGLTNGIAYTFTVVARTAQGASPARSVRVTPAMSRGVWSAADVDGDRRNDLFAMDKDGLIRVYRGAGNATFRLYSRAGAVGGMTVHPNAKLGSDSSYIGLLDNGYLIATHISRSGYDHGATPVNRKWAARYLDSLADFSGDGRADMVAVTAAGNVYLYRGAGDTAQYAATATRLATGWSGMQAVSASADVTGDARADLLAVDAAGVLWIYPGTGRSSLGARRKVGAGYGALGAVFAPRDVTGDGRADLGAVTMDGRLVVYPGRGNGTFGGAIIVGKGWEAYL